MCTSIAQRKHGYMSQRLRSFKLNMLSALVILSACATADNRAPGLIDLQDQQLSTNQNFQFEITAYDNDNDMISFDFNLSPPPPTPTETSGGVPTLQKVSDYRAVFSWTPGNADIGTYSLTVIVTDERNQSSSETVNLRVVESVLNANQWGRFTEPLGEAAVFNLSENTCFETAVTLVADQFVPEEINVQLIPPSPSNASLTPNGAKRYLLTWCPSRDEVNNQVNFPFIFRATNTRGLEPIDKRFLVRLRTEARTDCPGSPPSIRHLPINDYRGVQNVEVLIEVSDDIGVKSAPTLFYQILSNSPGVSPSEQWDSLVMLGDGQAQDGSWSGTIPAPQNPTGSVIFYKFLVSDDDDAEGPDCDHNIESEVFQFTYQWDESVIGLGAGLCDTCVNDVQCGGVGDHCLMTQGDLLGVCGVSCNLDRDCPNGYRCLEVTSINQQFGLQCISENACGLECIPDRFEATTVADGSNNVHVTGTPVMSGRYENLSICSGDVDFYLIDIPAGDTLTARIEFSHRSGDLELQAGLYDPTEFEASKSSFSVSDVEEVILSCVANDTTAVVKAFAHSAAVNQYALELRVANEPCVEECVPDSYEYPVPNNAPIDATDIELNQTINGTICPQDVDHFGLQLSAGSRVEIRLDHDSNQSDLDLDLLDSYDEVLTSARSMGRDVELLEFNAPEDDEYVVKVYHVNGNGNVSYRLTVRGGESLCDSSTECPLGQYCDGGGVCTSNACQSNCEAGHSCISPIAGRVPMNESGTCAPICQSNQECRQGESCKAFESYTSRCALSGTGQIAQPCQSFSDCSGKMICLPAPGGYCAAAGCRSDSECSSDAICDSTVGGVPSCLKRCTVDADCSRGDLRCASVGRGMACIP